MEEKIPQTMIPHLLQERDHRAILNVACYRSTMSGKSSIFTQTTIQCRDGKVQCAEDSLQEGITFFLISTPTLTVTLKQCSCTTQRCRGGSEAIQQVDRGNTKAPSTAFQHGKTMDQECVPIPEASANTPKGHRTQFVLKT